MLVGLVSLFHGISIFVGYLMPIAILLEEHLYYLTDTRINNKVHAFSKCISPKVNVIAWLEFELTTMSLSIEDSSQI